MQAGKAYLTFCWNLGSMSEDAMEKYMKEYEETRDQYKSSKRRRIGSAVTGSFCAATGTFIILNGVSNPGENLYGFIGLSVLWNTSSAINFYIAGNLGGKIGTLKEKLSKYKV